jgi:hypothetical protein
MQGLKERPRRCWKLYLEAGTSIKFCNAKDNTKTKITGYLTMLFQLQRLFSTAWCHIHHGFLFRSSKEVEIKCMNRSCRDAFSERSGSILTTLFGHKYSTDTKNELKILDINTWIREYQIRWSQSLGRLEKFHNPRMFYKYQSNIKTDMRHPEMWCDEETSFNTFIHFNRSHNYILKIFKMKV